MGNDYYDGPDDTIDRDALNHSSDAIHRASRTHGTRVSPGGREAGGYRPDGAREPGDARGEHPKR